MEELRDSLVHGVGASDLRLSASRGGYEGLEVVQQQSPVDHQHLGRLAEERHAVGKVVAVVDAGLLVQSAGEGEVEDYVKEERNLRIDETTSSSLPRSRKACCMTSNPCG